MTFSWQTSKVPGRVVVAEMQEDENSGDVEGGASASSSPSFVDDFFVFVGDGDGAVVGGGNESADIVVIGRRFPTSTEGDIDGHVVSIEPFVFFVLKYFAFAVVY